jgi:hypothetical protein
VVDPGETEGGEFPIDWLEQIAAPGTFGAWRPAYVATNLATATACCPTTMFWGMIPPENPPFSIA